MKLWDAVNNERMEDVQFLLIQGARSDWNNPRAIVSIMCTVVELCLCYFFIVGLFSLQKCRTALHNVVSHFDMCKELLKFPTCIDVRDEVIL